MDLIGETTSSRQKALTELDVFSDPVMFYVHALIATYSATTMESILEKFKNSPEVLNYVRQVIVTMEESGLIAFEDGKYVSKNPDNVTQFIKGHFKYLVPSLLKSSATRVFEDLEAGTHLKKSEFCSIYFMPDSPPKKAKLKALIADFNKRALEIINEDYTTDSYPVRIVGLVNSLPDAEDFV